MDLQEQYIEEYASGFNDAAILAIHAPDMLHEIEQDNNPQTDYFEGFFAGKDYYQEQQQSKELEELDGLRNRSKDRDIEHERD